MNVYAPTLVAAGTIQGTQLLTGTTTGPKVMGYGTPTGTDPAMYGMGVASSELTLFGPSAATKASFGYYTGAGPTYTFNPKVTFSNAGDITRVRNLGGNAAAGTEGGRVTKLWVVDIDYSGTLTPAPSGGGALTVLGEVNYPTIATVPAAGRVFASYTHGFGVVPSRVRVTIRCTAADQGYAINDEVDISVIYDGNSRQPFAVIANASTVRLLFPRMSDLAYIPQMDADDYDTINTSSWKVKTYAGV